MVNVHGQYSSYLMKP
ncbi:hypothetical protein PN472_01210 [Microcystis aeruginosa CS-1036]|nr:hypothetical protein [Microcystis aeruginosa]MDB9541789.1 hypothetical protein [Microcystis aeruginosa CS-1036]